MEKTSYELKVKSTEKINKCNKDTDVIVAKIVYQDDVGNKWVQVGDPSILDGINPEAPVKITRENPQNTLKK